ncbi:MAG: ribonuclease HII [Bacteroidetes bacterium]|nr:ribonuclease HII [Bacteroidota bacterium]
MLKSYFDIALVEAGCDEAGRGCLAGPVFAAAVILPKNFQNDALRDSKKLSLRQRLSLRPLIEKQALAWAVASVEPDEIDSINILNASFLAMHKAINSLKTIPQLLLIDGNRFRPYKNIPHICIIKGDDKYLSIAAASVLAKTNRDDYMIRIHSEFPQYNWSGNKGYGTLVHREAIARYGMTLYHRKSFKWSVQLKLPFN